MNMVVSGNLRGIEMKLTRLLAYISLAFFSWYTSSNALAGPKDLADSVKATIAANEPEKWPDHCETYRAEVLNEEPASQPQRVEPLVTTSEIPKFRVAVWNGIRIPLPDTQFEKVALIPGSISAVRSKDTYVFFSIIDLTPHFDDHFAEIKEFSSYVEHGRNLVDWIDDGLALRAEDLQCRPESMIDDMIRLVHSLFTQIAVLADEETVLMRLEGDHPAMVLGDVTQSEKPYRIQYIVQPASSENIEMVTITYHLDQPSDLIQLMSAFVSTIENGGGKPDSGVENIVRAILDQDQDRASSIAKSIDLDVKVGLQ